jgi:hypothetical protein
MIQHDQSFQTLGLIDSLGTYLPLLFCLLIDHILELKGISYQYRSSSFI